MVDPIKRIRQTLHSIYPLSYRIKSLTPSREVMEKKLFIQILEGLKQIDDRRDFMHSEIGMDMTVYEDSFFLVIENLLKLHFTKEQLALIQMYLYQLNPDDDWDGTITVEKGKVEKVLPFKKPEDVWNVLKELE